MAQKFLTNIDLNKNELQNAKIQNLGTAPTSPEDGQVYFDTGDNALKIYDGTSWVNLHEGDISRVIAGTGLTGGGTSGDVTLSIDNTGVSAASYGSTTAIPVLTINAQGQITAASTAAISSTLTVSDGTTTDNISIGTDTLVFYGGTGVTTTASAVDNRVTFAIGQDVGTSANVTFNSVTASLTGNADTATEATNITAVANNSTNETVYLTFVDGATGTQGIETDTGLTYNPSTGVLTTTSVTGNLTGNVTGNADTATALATGRTIALSGDVAASGVSFDGTGNITLTTTIQANSVALGTDTTGDYVASLVAGTGVTLSNNSGETATPTVAIGQAVGTSDNVTFNDVTVSGDLTVSGTTTQIDTATLTVEDPLIILASGNNAADAVDIGFYGLYDTSGSQDLYAGLFRDASDSGKFKLFRDLQAAPGTTVDTGGTGYTVGTLVATIEGNVTGDLTGNADTATALETARTINGTSFDGTANITVTAAAGTLTGTTLNSTVVTSSLTTVGTIGTGEWQATDVAVAHGGTGASDAATARTNLGVAIGSNVQAYDAGLADIAGLAVTDGNIIVGDGTNWVAESGATARTSLGVAIGSDVQAYDAGLADISALAVTDGNIIVGDGSNWVAESGATARTSLGLTIGTDVQAYDAELAAIAGLTSAADKVPYFTGSGTADVATFTAFGRSLVDDADAAAARTTLGGVPRKVTATIGDNSNTALAVTHNLATDDIIVEVYDASTKETIVCDVDRTSVNEVTLTFATAPGTNAFKVVIVG